MQRNNILISTIALLLTFSFLFCAQPNPEVAEPNGYLFIIGGGKRPNSMMKRFIELADGFNRGKIIILPMASAAPAETGQYQEEQLCELGAKAIPSISSQKK